MIRLKREHAIGTVLAFSIGIASTCANATIVTDTLFEDNFNRPESGSLGANWVEIENTELDVAIRGDRMRMRDSQPGIDAAASSSTGIDASEYFNIVIEFDWRPKDESDANDDFRVRYCVSGTACGATTNDGWLVAGVLDLGGFDWVIGQTFTGMARLTAVSHK